MHPKAEEFLYLLLWTSEMFMQGNFRNLTDSYESWVYRNGFMRQVKRLERGRLLEAGPRKSLDERVYRLTEAGRQHALGGRDPETQWARPWDGKWRLIAFDLPSGDHARRAGLWRYLTDRCFGHVQNSVWITPDPLDPESELMAGARIDVESLLLLEARPCAGESDAEIVAGAWDFKLINRRYGRLQKVLDQRPTGSLRESANAAALRRWASEERRAWLEAVSIDPLLPEALLPSDYLGRAAWEGRKRVLREAALQLRTFER